MFNKINSSLDINLLKDFSYNLGKSFLLIEKLHFGELIGKLANKLHPKTTTSA